ncbi:MAG: polyisoprenoid-binding protein [Proteobacteria bacterium]|nr:polyisoprenoid-binding protein [Pseudomonadota bacterium]
MRKILLSLISILFICCSITQVNAAEQKDLRETYILDPNHTYVMWHIDHFGFSEPSGKWFANGTIMFDKDKIQNCSINAYIDVADVVTGISKLDEHLKGGDFFNVVQFPKATFVSTRIESTSNLTAKVEGTLTVKGIAQLVVLDVIINKIGVSPLNQLPTIGFTATTKVKRSDFGITAYLPGLADDVSLEIQGEATLKK